ncbi:MAG TPA: hypothetical protein PKA06_04935, partial [Gemmatales bacterium]|nr:hypothetical protein [Gemmatales bacterium]
MRQAAESLLEMIDSDKRLGKRARKLGVSAFDRLSYQQKTVLLCQVVHALHDPLVPEMPLSSMSESVVAALFKMMHEILRFNLAFQPPDEKDAQLQFRKAILKAARESNEPLKKVPLLRSTELEPWAEVLNEIEERVLWDADYAMEEMFLDLPPDQAQQKKEFLRIDQDYFVAVAPDPTEVEYETARHR